LVPIILTCLLSCTVSKLWLIIGKIFASDRRTLIIFHAVAGVDHLLILPSVSVYLSCICYYETEPRTNCYYTASSFIIVNDLAFCRAWSLNECVMLCHLYAIGPESYTEFGEIMPNKGHYAVQGYSGSPILVPIENSCTTSY